MVYASTHNKNMHALLTAKLTKLTLPSSSSSSPPPPPPPPPPPSSSTAALLDFDFSDVFGPTNSSLPSFPGDPQHNEQQPAVIHNRSHSFVGPSPRLTPPSSLSFFREVKSQIEEEEDDLEISTGDGVQKEKGADESENDGGENSEGKVGVGDFDILRVVGKGAFGKVFLVRKKGDSKGNGPNNDGIYAMKVMRKDTIIKKNHVDYMKAERDILTKVSHPFIVQLRYSFQSKSKLYLILDFINGGHLFFHLYRQGIFSEDQARVYAAEIVSAVSHLHDCGIVHRDLKPENILMDADGHVVLTDFGLAKEIDESSRSNSLCGTTEYMAPEILLSKGHNKDADWWSVGVLLYEMLSGKPPFTHANRKKLQERIIKEKVKLPSYLSTEAHSLLRGLLQKDPSKRLGSGPNRGADIKNHKWFRPVNWKKLECRELQPKFKPDVKGNDCTANFDNCWTTMPPDDSPAPTPTDGGHFHGYSYVAPDPWLSSSG
ncbi:Serine/threonine-protein kinase AtPK2/AtPK19, partial [Cucurbita argyrosperma subsp. argyrosperma]